VGSGNGPFTLFLCLFCQVTASEIPADAATCKAGLDAAAKAVIASNGDFTTVQQPTGATLAGDECVAFHLSPNLMSMFPHLLSSI